MGRSKSFKFALKLFGKKNISQITEIGNKFSEKYKVIVFVPVDYSDKLTFELSLAGAGIIGNYSLCSFRTKGVGTFMGSESTNPVVGVKEKFEMIEEVKLEMICDKEKINEIIDKIYKFHPYEEPAYEVYTVLVRENKKQLDTTLIKLKKTVEVSKILSKLNKSLDTKVIQKEIKNGKFSYAAVNYSDEDIGNILPVIRNTLLITKINNSIKLRLI